MQGRRAPWAWIPWVVSMPQVEVRLKVVPTTGARPVTVQHAATAVPAAHRLQGAPCTPASGEQCRKLCCGSPGPGSSGLHRPAWTKGRPQRGATGPATPGATRIRGSSHVKGSSPPPGSDPESVRGSATAPSSGGFQSWLCDLRHPLKCVQVHAPPVAVPCGQ